MITTCRMTRRAARPTGRSVWQPRLDPLETRRLLAFENGPLLTETFDELNLTPMQLISPKGWDDNATLVDASQNPPAYTATNHPVFHHLIQSFGEFEAELDSGPGVGTTTNAGLPQQSLTIFRCIDAITFPDVNPKTEAVRIAAIDVHRNGEPYVVQFYGRGGIETVVDRYGPLQPPPAFVYYNGTSAGTGIPPTLLGSGPPSAAGWDTIFALSSDSLSNGNKLGSIGEIVVSSPGQREFDNIRLFVGNPILETPPVAMDFNAQTLPKTPVDIPALDHASDVDGDPVSIQSVTNGATISGVFVPSTGTATTDGTTVRYTPAANFHGFDHISYTVRDSHGNSATASIAIAVDTPPVAGGRAYELPHGSTGALSVPSPGYPGLLTLATDADTDPITVVPVTNEATAGGGSVDIRADGSFVYTPPPGIIPGGDTFTYRVNDGLVDSARGTITIRVQDTAPIAGVTGSSSTDVSYRFDHVPFESPVVLSGSTIIGPLPAFDAEGDHLTFIKVSDPSNGRVKLNANGTFLYNATAIDDSFQYKVFDGEYESNVATVHLHVDDRAPVALNDNYGTPNIGSLTPAPTIGTGLGYFGFDTQLQPANGDQGTGFPSPLANVFGPFSVLSNDSDPENDSLTPIIVQRPAHGDILIRPNGTFSYRLTPGQPQSIIQDEFEYVANDGYTDSQPAVVRLLFAAQPLVLDNTVAIRTTLHSPQVVRAPELLAGALDWRGNPLLESPYPWTAILHEYDTSAIAAIDLRPDGDLIIDPQVGFVGRTTLTLKITQAGPSDPGQSLVSPTATITIDVGTAGGVPPPVGNLDSYSVVQGRAILLGSAPSVLNNDSSSGSLPLTAVLITPPTHDVRFQFFSGGEFLYQPDPTFSGFDEFTYAPVQGSEAGDPVHVQIQILKDSNGNGIPDVIEQQAPNHGDGNYDGIPDYLEPSVASLNSGTPADNLTLAADNARVAEFSSIPYPDSFKSEFGDVAATFLSFQLILPAPGLATTVTIFYPPYPGSAPQTVNYFKFGATPDNPTLHWYEFTFDGTTGEQFLPPTTRADGTVVPARLVLHLIDGGRGDDDGLANGVIEDPGAIVFRQVAPPTIAFVTALYERVLEREPTSAELTSATGRLAAGAPRLTLARDVWRSPEHRAMEVNRLYGDFLRRMPDPAERTFWIRALERGTGEARVGVRLLTALEFRRTHASLDAFVSGLESSVVGLSAGRRDPQLRRLLRLGSRVSRAELARDVLTSPRVLAQLVRADDNAFLDRAPRAGDVRSVVEAVRRAPSASDLIAERILSSSEFFEHVSGMSSKAAAPRPLGGVPEARGGLVRAAVTRPPPRE
jgi:hypothetical protein